MSIKVAQKRFIRKIKDLTPLQILPKNVGDQGKIIVAKGFEKLVTLKATPVPTAWNASQGTKIFGFLACKPR